MLLHAVGGPVHEREPRRDQLCRGHRFVLQQREVALEFVGHGRVLRVPGVAQVLGCLSVLGVYGEPELLGHILVLLDSRKERLALAVEVVYLVLYLLEVDVHALDDLDLDQLLKLEARAGSDQEDDLDVGLVGRVERLPGPALEAVLHLHHLGEGERGEPLEDALGRGGRVGHDGPAEQVLQLLEAGLDHACQPLLVEFGVVLGGLLVEFDLAARLGLGRREEPVCSGNTVGLDQRLVEQGADRRVDARTLRESVSQQACIDVCLPGAVGRFTEYVLLGHCFAELRVQLIA